MAKHPKESYVHPIMVATEAPHPWIAVWRFRSIMTAISLVIAGIAFVFVQYINGAYQGQDPTFEPGGSNLQAPVETSAPIPVETPGSTPASSPAKTPSTEGQLGGPG